MRTAYYSLTKEDMQKIAEQNSNKGYEGFLTLIGTGDNREAVMNVDAGYVGALISKDGLFQIGDEIVKVGYTQSKSVEKVSESALQQLVNSNWENTGSAKIKTYDVQRKVYTIESARVQDREATCEDRYRSDLRFRSELWETNQPPAYSGVGGRAKHQNRFLRVWWADNAPQIRLQINGTFNQDGFSQVVNYDSGIRYNQNIVEWLFEQCVNFSCTFGYSYGTTVRTTGVGDDNAPHGCTATGY
jgi:hypothetical protein